MRDDGGGGAKNKPFSHKDKFPFFTLISFLSRSGSEGEVRREFSSSYFGPRKDKI